MPESIKQELPKEETKEESKVKKDDLRDRHLEFKQSKIISRFHSEKI